MIGFLWFLLGTLAIGAKEKWQVETASHKADALREQVIANSPALSYFERKRKRLEQEEIDRQNKKKPEA